jgi:hypothetical protein
MDRRRSVRGTKVKQKNVFFFFFFFFFSHQRKGIIIFALVNVALFAERFYLYCCTEEKMDVFDLFSWGLPIARGAAGPIKFNSAILLFTVMRNFLTFLRSTWVAKLLPLDKNIVFHKGFAWAIAFWVAVHGAAHNMNYFNLSLKDRDLLFWLPKAEEGDPNRIPTWYFAWSTVPGATGHLLVITMAFMYSSAITSIRRPDVRVLLVHAPPLHSVLHSADLPRLSGRARGAERVDVRHRTDHLLRDRARHPHYAAATRTPCW